MKTGQIPRLLTKALNAFFTTAILVLAGLALFRPDLVEKGILAVGEWVRYIGPWNYLLAFASSCIESFPVNGVRVPGQQVMLLVGGFYGHDHLLPILALASAGAMFGNWIGYALGAKYGTSFFYHHGDTFGIGLTELKILENQIRKNGPWFVVLGKFHNTTRSFVPFIAGAMGMKAQKFWIYNLVGSVVWACSMMVLGIFFAQYLKTVLEYVGHVFLALFIGVALYVYFFKRPEFLAYVREKQREAQLKSERK